MIVKSAIGDVDDFFLNKIARYNKKFENNILQIINTVKYNSKIPK